MLTSIDGKIIGKYMATPEGKAAGDIFYNIAFGDDPFYDHQGWLSGRVTTDDNFTHHRAPEIDDNAAPVPDGDFIAVSDAAKYYVSVDPRGKLGWQSPDLTYGDTTAHVLEVLTAQASNAYKAFLRELGISYIIVGDKALDYELLLDKLSTSFGIKTLMLGGGGVLNWSFIQAGMCDEVSVVIAPTADGATDSPSLFETREQAPDDPMSFQLLAAEPHEGGSVWLRYKITTDTEEKK